MHVVSLWARTVHVVSPAFKRVRSQSICPQLYQYGVGCGGLELPRLKVPQPFLQMLGVQPREQCILRGIDAVVLVALRPKALRRQALALVAAHQLRGTVEEPIHQRQLRRARVAVAGALDEPRKSPRAGF